MAHPWAVARVREEVASLMGDRLPRAADLHRLAGRPKEARTHLQRALSLARNEPERQMIQSRLASL